MPQYEAELSDGRVVTVESDNPPTEDQILSAIGGQQRPAAAALTSEVLPRFTPTRELAPAPEGEEEFLQAQAHPLTAPIAKIIPRVSEETMGKVASFLPSVAREWYEAIPETRTSPEEPPQPSLKEKALYVLAGATPSDKAIAVATGVQNAAADLGNFFTSPLGIATLGIGSLPAAAARAIAIGFAATMAKDVPDIAKQLGEELGKPEDQRDYRKISELTANAIANTGFAALGGAHGAGRPLAEKLGAYPAETTPEITQEKGQAKLPAGDPIISAAIKMPNGQINEGQFHALIEGSDEGERGFVTQSGKFLTMDQAENYPRGEMRMTVRGDLSADEIEDPYRRLAYAKEELKSATGEEADHLERLITSTEEEINNKKKGQPNAEAIRGNQGQLLAPGQEPQRSGEIGGNDIQQPPSGPPNAPGQAEAPPNVPNEARVTPTANELISMSPADYNTWKKSIKYGPDDAAKIAANLSDSDIERLAAERDKVRAEVSKLTDPEEIMRISLKSQTLNEIVQAKGEETPPPPPPPAVTQPTGRGLAGDVRVKWATATAEPFGSQAGFINLEPLKDLATGLGRGVRASIEAVRAAGKEAFDPKKMNDYRRSVLNWSARLQKSFGEASDAQKEIMAKVRDPVKREGITNWLQADGDAVTLRARAAATSDPKLKRGYEAALNLTPEEIDVARDVRAAFDALLNRGMSYDVIKAFKDNYVTQIWDLGNRFGNATRTLKDKFRFSRASTFANYFEGEQNGFKPKTKDIAKILPLYLHEMNSVIAARQLVAELSKGLASDGRPLVIPRGGASQIESAGGDKSTLIMPKSFGRMGQAPFDVRDYKVLPNQPAFNDWRWVSKDDAGNPIFLKSDLALHPEAYNRIKNVLGQSAIREWYNTPTSAKAAIPKAIIKGIDIGQGEVKRTMLGLFAPFHQVQEGTHALGHRVNPFFNIPEIDLTRPDQMDAAKHGLMMLPDRASAEQFMEGFKVSGLVSRIPGIGPAADWYSNYLFHQYIPGIKFKTYQAILDRNMKVFSDDLASGKVKPEDVKTLSAEQTNAAYGHLNYADLGRNPTVQHLLRWGLLAPDFLEARGRFGAQALQGLTGAKVGREQLLAVATLALGQIVGSYAAAKATGGDWDSKRPFEFRNGNKTYYLRSVPEDAFKLLTETRQFVYNRLNPIIGKALVQGISGTDWRGQKVTTGETLKELAQQPIPLMLRGILGLGHTPLSWWEQTLGAIGLKISRYSASNDIYKMVQEFKKNSNNPKLVAEYERDRKTVNPESDYKPMRDALIKGDYSGASKEYDKLLQTKNPDLIVQTMRPYTDIRIPGTDVSERRYKPFTGSRQFEPQFKASLNEQEKALYQKAIDERMDTFKKFREMLRQRQSKQ